MTSSPPWCCTTCRTGRAPLAELRRVLRPGGRLIASVDHPCRATRCFRPGTDYFATCERTEEWTFGGQSVPMRFWHRPLPAMISAFTKAGFRIAAIDEPLPAPDTPRELRPPTSARADILCFIFFVLEAD